MAEEDNDSKTEEPSDKKLANARSEGSLAISNEVKIWAGLLGTLVVVAFMAPMVAGGMSRSLRPFLEHPHLIATDEHALTALLADMVVKMGILLAGPLAILLILGLAGGIAQTGLLVTAAKIKPDLSKISPLAGFKRLFSLRSLVEFGKGIAKLVITGVVAFFVMWPERHHLEAMASLDLMATLLYVHDNLIVLIAAVVMTMTLVAAADYFYQRFAFRKQMRMTKQEVKDEYKQQEGDPLIKSRIRSLRQQRARKRMMQAVPEATVVVTNPTHYAIAMKYDQDTMQAPIVVAKGVDLIAKRIRDIADENEVPIVENPPLARALYATVEIDQEVPQEHYKAVAEVIGYVMRLKGHLARN
jgi:flagellar biosynthetic protein FlhB